MTLAFEVGSCSVLVEPSGQGGKPQPITAHNRHYVPLPLGLCALVHRFEPSG